MPGPVEARGSVIGGATGGTTGDGPRTTGGGVTGAAGVRGASAAGEAAGFGVDVTTFGLTTGCGAETIAFLRCSSRRAALSFSISSLVRTIAPTGNAGLIDAPAGGTATDGGAETPRGDGVAGGEEMPLGTATGGAPLGIGGGAGGVGIEGTGGADGALAAGFGAATAVFGAGVASASGADGAVSCGFSTTAASSLAALSAVLGSDFGWAAASVASAPFLPNSSRILSAEILSIVLEALLMS